MGKSWPSAMLRIGTALALMVGLIAAVVPAGATAPTRAFEPAPCPPDIFASRPRVTCGFLTVPENRDRPDGRTIKVAAAIVHAPAARQEADPIVFVGGGPSFGAIAPFALGAYFRGASLIEDRDVILVDTRGTGLSQPRLGCPEFDRAYEASVYSAPFVDSRFDELMTTAVRKCRNRLTRAGIDLSAYNSAESAADLDDLRVALGYERWNLVASSADGVLGLTYMRLFPDGIRSAIIDSGHSPQMLGPLDYARGNTEVLERVFAGCAANPACNATYPNIRTLFFDLVDRLQEHPEEIRIPDFEPTPVTFRIDGVWFYIDAMYGIFAGNRFEPQHIHDLLDEFWRATHGELAAVMRERFGTGPVVVNDDDFVARGKTMSYLCHDVVGFITRRDLRQAAEDVPALAPDFLRPHYYLPDGPAGCRIWDVGLAEPAQHQPVTSSIPTLVLAGEFDSGGGVPPYITRQIPPTLPNSFYYEFPAGGHLQIAAFNFASRCARTIADQFLDAPHQEPDSSCVATVAPFDFTPPTETAGPAVEATGA